jgi:hypothetical protein
MSDELLKITDDLWCLWSNIADGPKVWGDRQEVREWMMRHGSTRPPCPHCGYHEIDDRFDRAEAHGTSMRDATEPPKGFIYNQMGWLPWDRMEAFLRSYSPAPSGEAHASRFDINLLDPLEK